MSGILRSEMIGTGARALAANQHAGGAVTLAGYSVSCSATIHIHPTSIAGLIAFLQSCTPAAPERCRCGFDSENGVCTATGVHTSECPWERTPAESAEGTR